MITKKKPTNRYTGRLIPPTHFRLEFLLSLTASDRKKAMNPFAKKPKKPES